MRQQLLTTTAGEVNQAIEKAINRRSKPGVAFELLAAVAAAGSPGVPPPLRRTIETCIALARGAS